MKKYFCLHTVFALLLIFVFLGSSILIPKKVMADSINTTDFVTTWDTNYASVGTSQTSITIPVVPSGYQLSYSYQVDWNNDGDFSDTGEATLNTGSVTHDYGVGNGGIKTIRIRGTFPAIFFNNIGDKAKILSVDQWGNNVWSTMYGAFYGCYHLNITASDVPNLTNVLNMSLMFAGASSLDSGGNWNWNTGNVRSMLYVFAGATAFNQPIGSWNTSNVSDMSYMFAGATAFNQPIGSWNTGNVWNMVGMFGTAEYWLNVGSGSAVSFNQPIGSWDTSSVQIMRKMFNGAVSFNQPIGNWHTSNVMDMSYMFAGATSFNQNINFTQSGDYSSRHWFTGYVTDMSHMFAGATSFNQPIDWDTQHVTDMSYMFYNATAFNQDINRKEGSPVWYTHNVADMSYMFYGAISFNQPIWNWYTEDVTDMSYMFYGASSFNQDVSSKPNPGQGALWQTYNVTDMSNMFYQATSFNQNIGSWSLRDLWNASNMFKCVKLSTPNYDALLTGWDNQSLKQSNVVFSGGDSIYSTSATNRAHLISYNNWTITDREVNCMASCIGNTAPTTPNVTVSTTTVFKNTSVQFTASSTDSDGNNITYKADFGDGAGYQIVSSSFSKSWTVAGTKTVNIIAYDGCSSSSPATVTITVNTVEGLEDLILSYDPNSLTCSSINLTWNDNGADYYIVQQQESSGSMYPVSDHLSNSFNFLAVGLTENTPYQYIINYFKEGYSDDYSNYFLETTPSCPQSCGLPSTTERSEFPAQNELCSSGGDYSELTQATSTYEWKCTYADNSVNNCSILRKPCILDGAKILPGTNRIYYSSRIAKDCSTVRGIISCSEEGDLSGDTNTYKYRSCVTPNPSEF